MKNVKQESH